MTPHPIRRKKTRKKMRKKTRKKMKKEMKKKTRKKTKGDKLKGQIDSMVLWLSMKNMSYFGSKSLFEHLQLQTLF